MALKKKLIEEEITKLLKEIQKTRKKEQEYILYTELQRLKEIEAVLHYRDRESIEAEIEFHKETQKQILEQFTEDKMENLLQAIRFKPKVTELFHKEDKIIRDLQRQLSFHNQYTLQGEEQ